MVEIDKVLVGLNFLFGFSGVDWGEMFCMGNIFLWYLDCLLWFEVGEIFLGLDFIDSVFYGGVMFGGVLVSFCIMLKLMDEFWVCIEIV